MIHYQIPGSATKTYKSLICQTKEDTPVSHISNSLSEYLGEIKYRIELQLDDWDAFKRFTNPYEYIHTNVPNKRKSVSKYKPLSRSYFKMIEISHYFKLLNVSTKSPPIYTFHLAEGPGGFIEAIANMRQNRADDKYVGMTILDDLDDPNIPGWKKSKQFLNDHPNVFIESGGDQTGNILSIENFDYCCEKYGSTMDIITGDGGFDFSIDFNNQEVYITKLLFAQMSYALCLQKPGGRFILKIFDCFMLHTLDILLLLSSMYEKVYITKPQTSRYANSEKYLVCKGFRMIDRSLFLPLLRDTFIKTMTTNQHVQRFLSFPHSLHFLSRIEEYNAIFGRQQIENIYYTLSMIENKNKYDNKIDGLIRTNVIRCINWCNKYSIQFNNTE